MTVRRAAFTAIYVLACLLLLEGALQLQYRWSAGAWLFRRTALPIYASDEHSGFRLRPGLALDHRTPEFRTSIFTDSSGFRVAAPGDQVPREAGAGRRRVMVLGPSFAFGWGVEHGEAFPEALRRELERLGEGGSASGVEAVNAGVPALGPIAQLEWFRRRGAEWRPNLVVQFVYGSLEVSEEYSEGFRVNERGYLVPQEDGGGRRWRAALKRSAVVFRGWQAGTAARAMRTTASGAATVRGAGRALPPVARFDPIAPGPARALIFYEDLRGVVEEAGAELLIVTFPLSYLVHPEDLPRWTHLGVSDPATRRAFETDFARELNARGIRALDLTDELEAAARGGGGERLYYRIDIHWTPRGHEVAARAAAREIRGKSGGSR